MKEQALPNKIAIIKKDFLHRLEMKHIFSKHSGLSQEHQRSGEEGQCNRTCDLLGWCS